MKGDEIVHVYQVGGYKIRMVIICLQQQITTPHLEFDIGSELIIVIIIGKKNHLN
jgi:hypothetical protein